MADKKYKSKWNDDKTDYSVNSSTPTVKTFVEKVEKTKKEVVKAAGADLGIEEDGKKKKKLRSLLDWHGFKSPKDYEKHINSIE